ncbi:MAG: CbiX/SirB N-terminal domain-containing protein [Planctomycetes bacterium]|nr:CbiX/SirB N-terminal domain-containing protein [Planctomycetota bacterium]
MKIFIVTLVIAVAAAGFGAAALGVFAPARASSGPVIAGGRKVGVLLVSHGSRSARWREMLTAVEDPVARRVLADGSITAVRSAFMEYTEPSIATRLEEFDAEGFSDVIVVPLLLTVSSHSFDDIPTICGLKADAASTAHLRGEGVRIYKALARVHMTPLLDFPAMLEENVVRRVKDLSKSPAAEGAVLVAYGDTEYNAQWESLMGRLKDALSRRLGVTAAAHAWCGHIAHYSPKPTTQAIDEVLTKRQTAIVIPLLVAVDENFQHRLIGGAVQQSSDPSRVLYVPDAILPDAGLEAWVVDAALVARKAIETMK